jgi:hypothetical protein
VFVQAVVQATPRTHLNGQLHEPDL